MQQRRKRKNSCQTFKESCFIFDGYYGGTIDENGTFHILDKEEASFAPTKYDFGVPAVEIACCSSIRWSSIWKWETKQ